MKFHLFEFWSRIQKFISIFILRKIQLLILHHEINHIYGSARIDYGPNELIVLCLVRNGEPYMKSFVEHYFIMGVKHIFFLDNDSTDYTVLIAQNYENVTILQSKLPYKKYQFVMKQYLISRFAKNGWGLYVDIDELFDYPFSDVLPLSSLLHYLNEKSYTAVVTYMLDMFSGESLSNLNSKNDDNLLNSSKYYDISDITKVDYYFYRNAISNDNIKLYFGGIFRMLFGSDNDLRPILTKHPLILFNRIIQPKYPGLHGVLNARIADFTGVLFHYKFLNDFYERTLRAAQEENYHNNSAKYKRYLRILEQNPSLHIKQETSQELKSVNNLVDNGFLIVSRDFENFVKKYK